VSTPAKTTESPAELKARFRAFRTGPSEQRTFVCSTTLPYHELGVCFCDAPFWKAVGFYIKAGIAGWIIRWPFNAPKIWILRKLGAKIGRNVYISVDVWIDPLFPDLLEIADDVILGVGAKIAMHECTTQTFKVGRVRIGKGAVVGGFAIIACGVDIGDGAMVAGGAAVGRNVPAGATVIGNPARILRKREAEGTP
jgi:acetyltransferase-like isoleucine patch superfamily enzyme